MSDKMKKNGFFLFMLLLFAVYVFFVLYFPLFDSNPHFQRYITQDFIHHTVPWLNYFLDSSSILHFRMDHWNQFSSSGAPNIAEIGTYYLPYYLLKIPYALNSNFLTGMHLQVFTLIHLVFAAMGMFLFLRLKVTKEWPSFVGALLFISVSFMVAVDWPGYIFAIAWLPWILLALEISKEKKSFLLLALASFIAFQQFAICPQFFMYEMIFLIFYLWYDQGLTKQSIKRIGLFYLLTFLYSAIYFLPLNNFSEFAVRQNYLNENYVDIMAARAVDVFQVVLLAPSQNYIHIYIGGLAVALIVILLISEKSKKDYSAVLTAIFLFFLSTDAGLFQRILRLLPGLADIRWHSRLSEIIVFVLLVLLVKAITTLKPDFKRDTKVVVAMLVISVVGFLLGVKYDWSAYQLNNKCEPLLYAILFLGIFWLLSYLNYIKILSIVKFKYLIAILLLLDMSRSFLIISQTRNTQYSLDVTGKVELTDEKYISKDTNINNITPWLFKRDFSTDFQDHRRPFDNYGSNQYNSFLLDRQYSSGAYSASGGEHSPAMLKRYDDFLKAIALNPQLYALDNVDNGAGYLPRAFTLNCFAVEPNDGATLDTISQKEFTGRDYVLLNTDPEYFDKVKPKKCLGNITKVGSVQEKDKITFAKIENKEPTILFISDNWFPGWNAYINGNKKEILRADYTFKAVSLSPGSNNVEFRYEPKSSKIGGLITWVSVLASLFFGVGEFIRKKYYIDRKVEHEQS